MLLLIRLTFVQLDVRADRQTDEEPICRHVVEFHDQTFITENVLNKKYTRKNSMRCLYVVLLPFFSVTINVCDLYQNVCDFLGLLKRTEYKGRNLNNWPAMKSCVGLTLTVRQCDGE